MQEQTVLISGATSGIGLVTARELARQGAKVVIIGRNPARADASVRSIRQDTGNPRVEGLVADLSSQAEVRRLADEFRQRYERLDILINNAGAVFYQRRLSADGLEMTLALNHLSHFMLTNLLLDMLQESPAPRIINVSSSAHRLARVDPERLNHHRMYTGWTAYSQTKLMNILFTYELARRMDDHFAVNCLHPGFVATNFGKSNGGIFRPMFEFFDIAAISPERGARTVIYLASAPEAGTSSGQYYVNCKPRPSSKESYKTDTARRLWDASRELTGVG